MLHTWNEMKVRTRLLEDPDVSPCVENLGLLNGAQLALMSREDCVSKCGGVRGVALFSKIKLGSMSPETSKRLVPLAYAMIRFRKMRWCLLKMMLMILILGHIPEGCSFCLDSAYQCFWFLPLSCACFAALCSRAILPKHLTGMRPHLLAHLSSLSRFLLYLSYSRTATSGVRSG